MLSQVFLSFTLSDCFQKNSSQLYSQGADTHVRLDSYHFLCFLLLCTIAHMAPVCMSPVHTVIDIKHAH